MKKADSNLYESAFFAYFVKLLNLTGFLLHMHFLVSYYEYFSAISLFVAYRMACFRISTS